MTTFTVTLEGDRCRVQIVMTWAGVGGIDRFFERLFAPRLLGALCRAELERLNGYAEAVGASAG